MKFLLYVAEEIQIISTKFGRWLNILC